MTLKCMHSPPKGGIWIGRIGGLCWIRLAARRDDLLSSMLPVYRELLKYDLHILVYTGDVDAIVPVSTTGSPDQWPLALARSCPLISWHGSMTCRTWRAIRVPA